MDSEALDVSVWTVSYVVVILIGGDVDGLKEQLNIVRLETEIYESGICDFVG